LQKEVMDLAQTISSQPGLVIIEAPMGEGKTEAAIYMADSWVTTRKQRGYYFALPTMATSNQMFGRVKAYLTKRYPKDSVNLMLLHGHASLSDDFEAIKDKFEIQNIENDDKISTTYDGVNAGVVASEWFTSRKRGLLSPFGVGTIDQSLLAVLQTRHVFVRLFGLSHKTIIIDEVHAYDAYMSTLLERLLEWLAALGSSVVLLSATLPKAKRDALLQAYQKGLTGKEILVSNEVDDIKYPRISWTNDSESHCKTIGTSPDIARELNLWIVNGDLPGNDGEYLLGQQLKEALQEGGCAAVICNTVDQAQKVYEALKPYFPVQDAGDGSPELDLLHARYLYGDRQKREERTIKRFGKDRTLRPRKAVLVATQIIEQSLDIDFDLMMTEMAPVDLLLQRSGRMHRHQADSMNVTVTRPEKLKTPTLWIYRPKLSDGVPFFGGGTEAVYDYHILLRSWLSLSEFVEKKPIKIPDDVEGLIEKVYDEKLSCPECEIAAIKTKWQQSLQNLQSEFGSERSEAENRYIKWPGFSGPLSQIVSDPREEDNPGIHQAHQALTRLAEPTVNVVCLYGKRSDCFLGNRHLTPLHFDIQPSTETIKQLLSRSVTISGHGLTEIIINNVENELPQILRQEPLLRHHRILYFDENGQCRNQGFLLHLDDDCGLVIEKEN
jgi:CRISPR-associated endonuclease/helicase Cas3